MWTIDMEFCQLRGLAAIPFAMSIRDMKTGRLVLSTPVDYDSKTMVAMGAEMARHQALLGKVMSTFGRQGYFSRWYEGDATHGMSMAAIGDHLRAAGFDPKTHRIVSWWSTFDCAAFARAIHGRSQLLDTMRTDALMELINTNDYVCLQPYNLADIVQKSAHFKSAACGFVHRALLPGKNMVMHLPDNDTEATLDIYKVFLEKTAMYVS
jgi:hypothetical protein